MFWFGSWLVVALVVSLVWVRRRRRIFCRSPEALERLRNRTVLVTGASSGLGEQLAREFFYHGCKVLLAARRQDQLIRVRDELMADDPSVEPPVVVPMDLGAEPETVEHLATELVERYPAIDILVNNAGVSTRAAAVDTVPQVERRMMMVNFLGPVTLTKVILRSMLSRASSGSILVVSSIQGRLAIPFRTSYSASKHALQAYFDSLRAELSTMVSKPITISVISPGYIRTNLSLNAMNADGTNYGRMDATTAQGYQPEMVARRCVEMVLNGDPDLVLAPVVPRLMVLIRTICPWLYFFAMNRYASKQSSIKTD